MEDVKDILLKVDGLGVTFFTRRGDVKAVDGISFTVRRGETLGLVGESGSGKSVTALSILRLIDEPGRITAGSIVFDGADLMKAGEEVVRSLRGRDISMVFQEPLTALNPVLTVGEQAMEQILAHRPSFGSACHPRRPAGRAEARKMVIGLFRDVHLDDPERVFYAYPHNLSGGMRQRAMIAMALSLKPKLLIADEPTTALDVTIQAGILDLFAEIKEKYGMSILFITHDFGIVAQLADRIAVMRKGRIVEQGAAEDIFYRPQTVYTKELLAAVPRIPAAEDGMGRFDQVWRRVPSEGTS